MDNNGALKKTIHNEKGVIYITYPFKSVTYMAHIAITFTKSNND